MMIVSVSGAHSGIGKTAFVEYLLSHLKGWSALKVTVIKDGPCPRERPCGVCQRQDSPFSIVSDSRIINQKGKDTQRMKLAGARRVLWLKAKPLGLKEGLKKALKKIRNSNGIVIEGNSVLKYLKPDFSIFVAAKGRAKLLRCS